MSLESLRDEAIRKHRLATRKVSRLRGKGVTNLGAFDARTDLKRVRRYNTRQLNAYIQRLDSFNSRSHQFVPDREGRGISSKDWKRYKQAESELNKRRKAYYDQVKDNVVGRRTVKESIEMRTTVNPGMTNPAVNMSFKNINRNSQQVSSINALRKLEAKTRRMSSPGYLAREARKGRQTAYMMLNDYGNERLVKRIQGLTASEWQELWLTPGMADRITEIYYHNDFLNDEEKHNERNKRLVESTPGYIETAESEIDLMIDQMVARRGMTKNRGR